MKMKLITSRVSIFAMLLAASSVLFAQQQQLTTMLSGMSANAERLKQYTFKQRTEMYYKGELKTTKLDEIHYDSRGERVVVPLGEQKTQSQPNFSGPGRRLMARKMASKQEDMKEYIDRLLALANRYARTDSALLRPALAKAELTTLGDTGQVRIAMRNFVKSGDVVMITLDSSKRPLKTEITTSLDDAPVSISLAYDQVREGPTYPGKIVLRSAEKQIDLRVYAYDYRL